MRQRPNQKTRRRPHRELGVFAKNGTLRLVELHPTKGFREMNGEHWRKEFQNAKDLNAPLKIRHGNRVLTMNPIVRSNAPTVRHNKTG